MTKWQKLLQRLYALDTGLRYEELAKILKGLDNFDSLSEAECKYFSELLMAIDEAGNIDNLPDNHLNKIMDELLNN